MPTITRENLVLECAASGSLIRLDARMLYSRCQGSLRLLIVFVMNFEIWSLILHLRYDLQFREFKVYLWPQCFKACKTSPYNCRCLFVVRHGVDIIIRCANFTREHCYYHYTILSLKKHMCHIYAILKWNSGLFFGACC